jgi:hypothetical protein
MTRSPHFLLAVGFTKCEINFTTQYVHSAASRGDVRLIQDLLDSYPVLLLLMLFAFLQFKGQILR